MGLITWAETRLKTFTIFDFGVFKICLVAFALLVAKLIPPNKGETGRSRFRGSPRVHAFSRDYECLPLHLARRPSR